MLSGLKLWQTASSTKPPYALKWREQTTLTKRNGSGLRRNGGGWQPRPRLGHDRPIDEARPLERAAGLDPAPIPADILSIDLPRPASFAPCVSHRVGYQPSWRVVLTHGRRCAQRRAGIGAQSSLHHTHSLRRAAAVKNRGWPRFLLGIASHVVDAIVISVGNKFASCEFYALNSAALANLCAPITPRPCDAVTPIVMLATCRTLVHSK